VKRGGKVASASSSKTWLAWRSFGLSASPSSVRRSSAWLLALASSRASNLLAGSRSGRAAEEVTVLLQTQALRLERIASYGHANPPGFWYDQPEEEWVTLLRGTATLVFAEGATLELAAGDCLTIHAHARHRVEKVSDDAVWLALHPKEPTR
jgi:cupin 2 domain-containing protein